MSEQDNTNSQKTQNLKIDEVLAQNAKNKVIEFKNDFEPKYEYFLNNYKNYIKQNFNDKCNFAFELFADISTRDAKRVRASLIYYVSQILNGFQSKRDYEDAIKMGFSIETTHSYLLILDDYTDKSLYRRHKPTAHILAQQKFSKHKDFEHIGIQFAIYSSLVGNHIATKIISELNGSDSTKVKLLNTTSENYIKTGFGQIMDFSNTFAESVSEDEIIKTFTLKTGRYTFQNPIEVALILAFKDKEIDEHLHSVLAEYAKYVGIAFQIYDDYLGVFGKSDETGKSNMDDIMEGKFTLIIKYAKNNATKAQLEVLEKGLGNPNLSENEYEQILEILITTGARNYAIERANFYMIRGLNALKKLPNKQKYNEEVIEFLIGLGHYIISRKN